MKTLDASKPPTTRQIGRRGELLLMQVLPDAQDMNEHGESRLPYDILWNDIKIDVKFCSRDSSTGSYTWSVHPTMSSKGIVVVYTAWQAGRYLFWVERCCRWGGVSKNARDALLEHELQEAIIQAHNLPDPTIETPSFPETIVLDHWDYSGLQKIQARYSEQYQTLFSVQDTMRQLIKDHRD